MATRPTAHRSLGGLQPAIFAVSVLGLFVLYFALRPAVPPEGEIRVTVEMAREIAAEREAVLGKAPSLGELASLVSNYADEEILLREAAARGIDCSGCNGRRHLIQRVLFLLDDPPSPPSDSQLATFFSANRERYKVPERLSFEHAFFSAKLSPASLETALESLREGASGASVGERYWMGDRLEDTTANEISAVMGERFAREVFAIEGGGWSGPHRSSRGYHLIRVTDRDAARMASLDEVRILVEQDWEREQRSSQRERLLAKLRPAYSVTIEPIDELL